MERKKIKVEVKNLTKSFGDLLVLDDINFEVYDGEFICIVGPTGCGKTTFLNLLSKLILPTKGNIFIEGVESSPQRHNISTVFQEPSCMPWRTVEQNISFGLEIKKFSNAESRTRVYRVLDLVGLRQVKDLYPKQLSSSMEQRVAIARAFATDPDLLVMDEPYSQLDIKLRYYLEEELIRLWKTLKSTVIFVTHNIEEAVYLAERVLVLTNKPTSVKNEVIIDLPRPRNPTDPKFISLRKEITDLIRWW